jgi:hypothetical protein
MGASVTPAELEEHLEAILGAPATRAALERGASVTVIVAQADRGPGTALGVLPAKYTLNEIATALGRMSDVVAVLAGHEASCAVCAPRSVQ